MCKSSMTCLPTRSTAPAACKRFKRVVLPGAGVPAFFFLPFATLAVFISCCLPCQLCVAMAANSLLKSLSSRVHCCPYAVCIAVARSPSVIHRACCSRRRQDAVWPTNQDSTTTQLLDKPNTTSIRSKVLSI